MYVDIAPGPVLCCVCIYQHDSSNHDCYKRPMFGYVIAAAPQKLATFLYSLFSFCFSTFSVQTKRRLFSKHSTLKSIYNIYKSAGHL